MLSCSHQKHINYRITPQFTEKIITAGELVVKAKYICSMQVDTNGIWYQHPQHQLITVLKHTILHPGLDVTAITDMNDIPKSVCNRTQAKKSTPRHPIGLTDSVYDYILE